MTENEKYLDYLQMLRKPFQKLVRLRFLQPDGSTAFMLDNRTGGPYAGTFISGGTITHNWQNGRRTNASITLDNVDGQYDYNYNSVWFGQEIALDEGLILSDGVTEFYIQQGVFLIETPTENVKPNQRTVSYNLVDKSAAIDGTLGGKLDGTYQVMVGTNIFSPIASLLAEDKGNGYPVDRVTPVFTEYYNNKTQELPDGTTANMTDAPYTLTIDGTDGTIWSVIKGLVSMVNGWVGYDETGALRVDPSQDDILDTNKPVLWEFTMQEAELLGLTYQVKNTEVYNDYICIGEALSDGIQPSGRAQILDSRSPVDINSIGRKTIRVSQAGFGTNTQCQDYAVWQVMRSAVLQRAVTISCSQIMHIRGNDLVTVTRTDKPGNPTERHLIKGFSRPLASSGPMTINAVSVNDFPIATVIYAGMIASVPKQAKAGRTIYTGNMLTPIWSGYLTSQLAISGTVSAANAGAYTVSFTPINGYIWWDGTDTPKTATWSINKKTLAIPTVSGSYTYNGSSQSVTLNNYDSNTMTKSGTASATNAGAYTVNFALKDADNYQWADGKTTSQTVTWTIGKATPSAPALSPNPVTMHPSSTATVAVTRDGNGTVTASLVSGQFRKLLSLSVSGTTVTLKTKAFSQFTATAIINVKVSEGTNYKATSATLEAVLQDP